MAFLVARGVGLLVRSMAGLSFTPTRRCSGLPSVASVVQCTTSRLFSNIFTSDDFPKAPPPDKPPKRPISSFLRFARDRRPVLRQHHPDASIAELATLLGAEWRTLPEIEKQVYIDEAETDLLKYRELIETYMESLDPADREMLRNIKKEKRKKLKSMRQKREKTVLGKPKRCRSPFNMYMSDQFPESTGGSVPQKLKNLRDQWEQLPSTKKQVYAQLAEDDKVRYENELKAWEEEMIEMGRGDLVRHKERHRLSKMSSPGKTTLDEKARVRNASTESKGRKTGHWKPEE